MKLTKKDKMMLLVLGLVIVIAVFYVYGIMPNNEKIEELEALVTQKREELDAINNRLSNLQTGVYEAKINKALEEHFSSSHGGNKLHPTMDRVELERTMYAFLKPFNVSHYATSGWTTNTINTEMTIDGVKVVYQYDETNIPLTCQIKTKDDFFKLIEEFRVNKDFVLSQISYNFNEKKEDEGEPEEGPSEAFNEVSCSLSLKYYSGNQYVSDFLPKALDDVRPALADGETDTLVFDKVKNALSYEAYLVNIDEGGKKTFTPIRAAKFVENEGKMTVQFTSAMITDEDKSHEVFIRAIGDKKKFYKSIMGDESNGILVTVA